MKYLPTLCGLWLALALPSHAALLTVGSNVATCDFTSLGSALDAAADGDDVIVEGKTWTHLTNINFNLIDKSLTIVGGYDADCSGASSTSPTILQGLGTDAVLEISSAGPATVVLKNFGIKGGDGTNGGGVAITGEVSVTMTDIVILENQATNGAGIYLDTGGGASLSLSRGSKLLSNTASGDGGGLYCTGSGSLELTQDLEISFNQASSGGGLYAGGCNVTMNGPASSSQSIEFLDNAASADGGALYVGSSALVTGDGGPYSQLRFGFNSAFRGGGVAVIGGASEARLTRAALSGNNASLGAGVYVNNGDFYLDAPAGDCHLVSCNFLTQNGTGLAGAVGGAFNAFNFGHIGIEAASLRSNEGNLAIGRVDQNSSVSLAGVSIANNTNQISDHGLWVGTASVATLFGVTFADQESMATLIEGDGTVHAESVIAAGEPTTLFGPDLDWDLDCAVLTTALAEPIPPDATNILVTPDPRFVDGPAGDHHLRNDSPAIDLCGDLGTGVDMDAQTRPMGAGMDAGGDETEPPIFTDGFESGDVSAWSSST